MRDAQLLSGKEAAYHVSWLAQVARRLVVDHAASIQMLAEALLQRPVLSGDEAAEIVKSARRRHQVSRIAAADEAVGGPH